MQTSDIRKRLDLEREAVFKSMSALIDDFDALVASSEGANNDDEHDPEGATIAFERAQLSALLDDARGALAAIDLALLKLCGDRYGRCERCGNPIAPERISALPSTKFCIHCAND